ncbi:MAG: MGMT family protein [Pseudomonadota bacterium]
MTSTKIRFPPDLGRVEKLFRKERHGKAMLALGPGDQLECIAQVGIQGDVHANRLSPRQILVTLQSELDAFDLVAGSLRENLVISSNATEFFRPGTALVMNNGVEIRLTMFCEPCQRLFPLVRDLGAMVNRRGILGRIEKGGTIALGESVLLYPDRYAALPESAYQKFLDFVATIPAGKVVRYLDVAIAIGVADSFVRAIPGYIKRSAGRDLPLHRIVNAQGKLLASMPDQAEKLSAEGIRVEVGTAHGDQASAAVALASYLWRG